MAELQAPIPAVRLRACPGCGRLQPHHVPTSMPCLCADCLCVLRPAVHAVMQRDQPTPIAGAPAQHLLTAPGTAHTAVLMHAR